MQLAFFKFTTDLIKKCRKSVFWWRCERMNIWKLFNGPPGALISGMICTAWWI